MTLMVSSFKASSSGEERKSGMTLTLPIGSSVYFIFSFIYFIAFQPIFGANNSGFVFTIGKSYSHNSKKPRCRHRLDCSPAYSYPSPGISPACSCPGAGGHRLKRGVLPIEVSIMPSEEEYEPETSFHQW